MRRALVLLALLALPATASAQDEHALSATLRHADSKIDWTNLRRSERLLVLRRYGRAPALLDRLLDKLAPKLALHRGAATDPAGGNHTDHLFGGNGRPWEINLSPDVLSLASPLNAHLTIHELGHVVDNVLYTDPFRERLIALFQRSKAWQPCYPMPLGSSSRCVSRPELLAEQFAFWGTGDMQVRSAYNVPPLASRRTFGKLLASLLR
jgi:hypothetical protein